MMEQFSWYEDMNCAVTVCDTEGVIVYQNKAARELYAKRGTLIGQNLFGCHNEHSQAIIRRLLAEGSTNAYTIEKKGVKKVIYQTAWRRADGSVGGLVEISMIVPDPMPHFVRE